MEQPVRLRITVDRRSARNFRPGRPVGLDEIADEIRGADSRAVVRVDRPIETKALEPRVAFDLIHIHVAVGEVVSTARDVGIAVVGAAIWDAIKRVLRRRAAATGRQQKARLYGPDGKVLKEIDVDPQDDD